MQPTCFTGMGLGLSCSHSSITTAAPVSTSQHCSLQPGHPVEAALGKCPAQALSALASLSRHILPKVASRASIAGKMMGKRHLVTVPRGKRLQPQVGSCCLNAPRSGQGPPVPGHWHYTPFLVYGFLEDPQTHPADPNSKDL